MNKNAKLQNIPKQCKNDSFTDLTNQDELVVLEKVMTDVLRPFLENVGQLLIIKHKTYLTEKEVALDYSIPVKTLQNKRSKKLGPVFIKDGEKVLYSRKAIEEYLQARHIKTIK